MLSHHPCKSQHRLRQSACLAVGGLVVNEANAVGFWLTGSGRTLDPRYGVRRNSVDELRGMTFMTSVTSIFIWEPLSIVSSLLSLMSLYRAAGQVGNGLFIGLG